MDGLATKRIEKRDKPGSLFGELLRNWRKMRNVSQLELALAAEVSQRHVSFLESGRSKPSSNMALALAEQLDMPLRARNELLAAAGYAAFYPERSLDSVALAPTVAILKRMLEHHEPFPAFVLDAGWNIVMVNQAAERLLGWFVARAKSSDDRAQANFLEIICDPGGLRPFVRSWPHTGAALLARLRRERRQITVRLPSDCCASFSPRMRSRLSA
ncbi:MAG: helix-turn-helix domain-containing protein [Bradyrhizobium sp.]|nr:MAG: helix-turn-helix domain-containing protein [Bradyrhizobium sp.]